MQNLHREGKNRNLDQKQRKIALEIPQREVLFSPASEDFSQPRQKKLYPKNATRNNSHIIGNFRNKKKVQENREKNLDLLRLHCQGATSSSR